MKKSCAFLVAALLAGCSGQRFREADERVRASDFDGAVRLLNSLAASRPGDTAVRSKLRQVSQRAGEHHAETTVGLVTSGDLDAAVLAAETAVYFDPDEAAHRSRLSELLALRRKSKEDVRQATVAVEQEDWFAAERLLSPIRVYEPTFPEIATLSKATRRGNFDIFLREGQRFLKLKDYDRSVAYFERALAVLPEEADASQGLETASRRKQARALAAEARKLLNAGDLLSALEKAQQASELHRGGKYVGAVLKESYRQATLDFLDRERRATEAGRPVEALGWAERAVALEPPQRQLKERAASRQLILSKQLAARHLRQGIAQEKQGLHGAAWVEYKVAASIREQFTGVAERLREATAKLEQDRVQRVVVLPPKEAPRAAPGAGKLVAAALRTALRDVMPTGVSLHSPEELAGDRLVSSGTHPDAVVHGEVRELWLTSQRPRIHRSTRRYEAGRVPALNPQVERQKAQWESMKQQVPQVAQQVATAERNARQYEAEVTRLQQTYDQEAQRPYNYQDVNAMMERQRRMNQIEGPLRQARQNLALAQAGLYMAQSTHQQTQSSANRLLEGYLTQPPYVFSPLDRTYQVEAVTFEVDATAQATFRVKDFVLNRWLEPRTAKARFSTPDSVVAEYRRANVQGDPYNMSSDHELLERLADRIAQPAAKALGDQLRGRGARLVERAAQEQKSGNTDAEIHYLVRAWQDRTTLDAGQTDEILHRVKELTGFDLAGDVVERALLEEALLEEALLEEALLEEPRGGARSDVK